MLLDDLGFDVIVGFDRMYRTSRLTEIPAHVPGATRVEVWDRQGATLALAGGTQRSVSLWGVPSGSKIFAPRIVSGRELLPDDGHAILLNSKIGADEGIRVGDQITMTVGSQESTWSVVGLVLNVNNQQRDNFVPLDALSQETGNVNRGALVMVTSKRQDSGNQQTLMRDLRDAYTDQRVEVAYVQSASEIREQNQMQFNIITYLMLSMATLAAIVGSLSLMGTMSINVVERRREIGMMRAIGATSSNVAGLVVAEGVLLGTLSWLIAAPLSYPGSRLFSRLVGDTLMQLPLDFSYSVGGMALWLLIVVVLSALASLWPALRATRVSVREALAYE
jgi:putative ABC transport system permease protein